MALLLLLAPALAVSQDVVDEPDAPLFDVEIIVLRHVEADDSELPVEPALPDEDAGSTERPRRARYDALAPAELRLGDINESLLRSQQWSPILHAGWRQPAESRENASLMAVAGSRRGAYVSGTLRLSVERFLRVEMDLQLDDGSGRDFRIEQARRLRSGEVHYFDHPRFGVIVLVSRTGQ